MLRKRIRIESSALDEAQSSKRARCSQDAIQVTVLVAGLAAFAVAGVLAAVAVLRSGVLPRWGGTAFAAGFALYLPQFFAAPELRIAHGVLIATGCVLLGAAVAAYAPPGTRSRRVTAARAASSSSGG
jgi:hypothetical protein